VSQQINLYEARLRPSRDLLTGRRLGRAVGLLMVVIVAAGALARVAAERAEAELRGVQAELTASQEKFAALAKTLSASKVSAGLQAQIDQAKVPLAARQAAMTLIDSGQLGNREGFSAILSGFSRQTSKDLWLTGFSVSLGGQEIEIRGRTLDAAGLPSYLQRLAAESAFKGRRFAALDMRRVDPAQDKPGEGAAPTPVAAAPALPRHVEFVLRSAGLAEATAGGKK
jgi:hypothetical protein